MYEIQDSKTNLISKTKCLGIFILKIHYWQLTEKIKPAQITYKRVENKRNPIKNYKNYVYQFSCEENVMGETPKFARKNPKASCYTMWIPLHCSTIHQRGHKPVTCPSINTTIQTSKIVATDWTSIAVLQYTNWLMVRTHFNGILWVLDRGKLEPLKLEADHVRVWQN